MTGKRPVLAGSAGICGALLMAPSASAEVEPGGWTSQSPSFNVQERGCGQVDPRPLHPLARPGVPASRQIRLPDPDRHPGHGGPSGDLVPVRGRPARRGCDGPGGGHRTVHPRRHRARGPDRRPDGVRADLEAIGSGKGDPRALGASTEDYLSAIAQCRPTVTPAMIEDFGADITDTHDSDRCRRSWLSVSCAACG